MTTKRDRPADEATDQAASPYREDVFYGWGQALTFLRSHFVPEGTEVRPHAGRIIGDGLCGFPGMVDEDGSVAGQLAKHCHICQGILDGTICRRCKGRQAIVVRDELAPGVHNAHEAVCPTCLGVGKPPQPPVYRP